MGKPNLGAIDGPVSSALEDGYETSIARVKNEIVERNLNYRYVNSVCKPVKRNRFPITLTASMTAQPLWWNWGWQGK